jgi:hypothetical protein
MVNCSLDEYLKLVDIIHDYDSILLTIKGWGVTLSLTALGFGFKEKAWGYFLLAAISGINFWGVEYFMKGYQMQYYPRMRAIEVIQYKKHCEFPPSIDYSWYVSKGILNGEKEKEIINTAPEIRGKYPYYIWYRRIGIVAFPHVFSVILGLLFSYLSFFKMGKFKEYET